MSVKGFLVDGTTQRYDYGSLDNNTIENIVGVYDIGTTYNTLDPTYNRTMAVYEIEDVNSTFVYEITNKSTEGNLNVRICSEPSPWAAALLQSVATIIPSDTSGNGTFTINSDVKANAKYILILNATSNLLVPFTASLYTQEGIYGSLKSEIGSSESFIGTDGQPW